MPFRCRVIRRLFSCVVLRTISFLWQGMSSWLADLSSLPARGIAAPGPGGLGSVLNAEEGVDKADAAALEISGVACGQRELVKQRCGGDQHVGRMAGSATCGEAPAHRPAAERDGLVTCRILHWRPRKSSSHWRFMGRFRRVRPKMSSSRVITETAKPLCRSAQATTFGSGRRRMSSLMMLVSMSGDTAQSPSVNGSRADGRTALRGGISRSMSSTRRRGRRR